jgi:hypothetical protein
MSFIKFPEQRSAESPEKIDGSEGLDRQNALSPSTASEYELGGRADGWLNIPFSPQRLLHGAV